LNKMKHSKRKISNAGYLIALLVLAAAAAAAAYYLYFYIPPLEPGPQDEILARPVTEREKTAQPQIKYAFKPDELKKRLISEIVVPKTTTELRPEAKTVTPTPVSKQARKEKASADTSNVKGDSGQVWALNVISTEDPQKARQFVELLRETRYTVYTYKVEDEKESWYRVRVGFFPTHQEAEDAAALLVEKFQMPRAWILKPTPMETARYNKPD